MSLIPAFEIGLWNAWILMSVFILQMLAIMFAGKRIWERSHVPAEARRNRLEKYAGMMGNLVWLLALVYSVFLPLRFSSVWFYVGLSGFAAGSIIMAIATFNFVAAPAGRVISQGVYRISRHPMYLATFLICLGAGFAAGSWLFIFLTVILALCFHQEALIEERYCREKYGEAYREYMNRVPRWIGLPRNPR